MIFAPTKQYPASGGNRGDLGISRLDYSWSILILRDIASITFARVVGLPDIYTPAFRRALQRMVVDSNHSIQAQQMAWDQQKWGVSV